LPELKATLVDQAVIFIGVGLWVTFLVSSNLTRPLEQIIRVLRKVREGKFDEKVRVASNDEIGYTGDVINEMSEGLKERDFIKDTFGKYVTQEIRDEILAGKVSLDGELKEVTVLFADLRNFTPLVEKTPPKEVVRIINSYFKEFKTEIILSGDTRARVNGDFPLKELPATRVKGKSESIQIFYLDSIS
jgi:adenylate cyclase